MSLNEKDVFNKTFVYINKYVGCDLVKVVKLVTRFLQVGIIVMLHGKRCGTMTTMLLLATHKCTRWGASKNL